MADGPSAATPATPTSRAQALGPESRQTPVPFPQNGAAILTGPKTGSVYAYTRNPPNAQDVATARGMVEMLKKDPDARLAVRGEHPTWERALTGTQALERAQQLLQDVEGRYNASRQRSSYEPAGTPRATPTVNPQLAALRTPGASGVAT